MRALAIDSVSPTAGPRNAESGQAAEAHTTLPPPALGLEPRMRTTSIEVQVDSHDTGLSDVHEQLLPGTPHTVSAESSPTIKPPSASHDQNAQIWPRRRIQSWRSPLLMVLFFALGAAVSIAHCLFYPLLNGKIVGNSDQQEEKIR